VIKSWDDGLDVVNRPLGRLKCTLENMNANMTASNERLAAGLRETGAKIGQPAFAGQDYHGRFVIDAKTPAPRGRNVVPLLRRMGEAVRMIFGLVESVDQLKAKHDVLSAKVDELRREVDQ
jgi:hypothetical protein